VDRALVAILLAPGVDHLWLIPVWVGAWATYRFVANTMPERLGRAAVDVAFFVLAFAAVFWGGLLFIPAWIAYLVLDLSRAQPVQAP
jgi:hypothetical protein